MSGERKERILQYFLKDQSRYISGEDISSALGISRAYVWKLIKELEADGCAVDALPRKGYRLVSTPDKLLDYLVKSRLKTAKMGKRGFHYFDSIPSTNDEAYALAEEKEPEGAIVVAETQRSGRGRMGRKWISPKGGIYLSIVLRPDVEADEVPTITLLAAVAVAKTVKKLTHLNVGIRWPNDILFEGKKLCGILTEIKAQPDRVDFLVLGIGINVNTPSSRLPNEGTSLKHIILKNIDRAAFLCEMLEQFERYYELFRKKGFASVREECKKLSLILGKEVRISEHHRVISGEALDIDEKGALVVKEHSGSKRRVFSGDVSLLK